MMETRKDIFGNTYQVIKPRPMSYAQKLKGAKAKQKYREFQIKTLKTSIQQTKTGLQKTGRLIKKGYNKATDKKLPSFRNKVEGSIYKKE